MTTSQPVTVAEVRTFLDGLARPQGLLGRFQRPATRVANSLRTLGVTGHPDSAAKCPIANALTRQFPGHSWEVTTGCIDGSNIFLFTPEPIQRFIHRFDDQGFPDLQAPIAIGRDWQ